MKKTQKKLLISHSSIFSQSSSSIRYKFFNPVFCFIDFLDILDKLISCDWQARSTTISSQPCSSLIRHKFFNHVFFSIDILEFFYPISNSKRFHLEDEGHDSERFRLCKCLEFFVVSDNLISIIYNLHLSTKCTILLHLFWLTHNWIVFALHVG